MFRPIMDSVSGRSYHQASQTPGAIGGRRDVVLWYSPGPMVDLPREATLSVRVRGAPWRILGVTARTWDVPISGNVRIQIFYFLPGDTVIQFPVFVGDPGYPISDDNIMFPPGVNPQVNAPLISGSNTGEATKGVIKKGLILPVGTLIGMGIHTSFSGGSAEDLTVELHYRTRAVSQ